MDRFVGVANSCMYLILASLFLSEVAGIYISSDGTCRLSSWSVLFSLVSPAPNAK